jgi:hypothetical protein
MNILNGDTIEIREQNYTDRGIVVDVEYAEGADYYVLADFGGNEPGRIPVRNGALPLHFHHISQS